MNKPEKIVLGTWPTPLEPLPRLSRAIGLAENDLWIKRDDLTGLGAGGNKIRKLEYTCAAAITSGADTLITVGAGQSNHARLTAAAGARLGLHVLLVLAGSAPAEPEGNILLNALCGAEIVWAGEVDDAGLEKRAKEEAQRLERNGRKVTFIPFGGSNVPAAYGYVDCGNELKVQAPDLAHVVTAIGSGGTMAGLVHSLGAERVYGVDAGAVEDPEDRVRNLVSGLAGRRYDEPLRIRRDMVGAGYSHLTGEVKEALELAARFGGIVLDPVYTGRAFAGLIAAVRDGEISAGVRTVFLHSGGLPGFFGHPQVREFFRGSGSDSAS